MKNFISSSKAILFLVFFFMVGSCKDDTDDSGTPPGTESRLIYHSEDVIFTSILSNVPPGEAVDEQTVYTIPNDWRFTALSLSPSGQYGTIALYSSAAANSRDHEGKIRVYAIAENTFIKEYTKSDLIDLLDYPVEEASMFIVNMDWMDNERLLIHMQPQTSWIESTPQNVSLILNVESDEAVEKQFSGRTNPYAIDAPDHPSKVKYSAEIQAGMLYIEGGKVQNLRQLSHFDVSFN